MDVVANELLEGRGFGFDVERAAFMSVLRRLVVSGSDRPCEEWMRDYAIDGIESLHLHHLGHSFASRALALGETLPVIGKLLGHSDIETTARYAHLAQDSLQETAERIAESIAADIL